MPIVAAKKTSWDALDPDERRRNFREVDQGYTLARARVEALRCLQCQDPGCEKGCPVGMPIRDFIDFILEDDLEAAYRRIREASRMPAICGRVCPQERFCEGHCVIAGKQEPVSIGRLERFTADWARQHGIKGPQPSGSRRSQRVAVVGSGPSGLTCAGDLAQLGYEVTIFEALPAVGGILVYGIPDFRLPKDLVKDVVDDVRQAGVEIKTSALVGKKVTIDQMLGELGYHAVFLGVGAGVSNSMDAPGEDLAGVYSANELLARVNLSDDGGGVEAMADSSLIEHLQPSLEIGRRVAVIGSGDAAMDAVQTALRLGAQEGHIIYRRTINEMTAHREAYHQTLEEGVTFHWLTLPVEFLGNKDGRVEAMKCVRMELGEPDESGRRRPLPISGSEFTIEVDTVAMAIGYSANTLAVAEGASLDADRRGRIVVDEETGATSREGVFAGGDITTGAATVVEAMRAGRKAAAAIDRYLQSGAG
jgi:glutamate synthase (NADPH/NADH) small chain